MSITIASRLELVRTIMGLSLQAFHKKLVKDGALTLTYAAVRNYHNGRTTPVEYLVAISQVYGVSLEWLATGNPKKDA